MVPTAGEAGLPVASVGVFRETHPRERRVALTPSVVPALIKAGLEVVVEAGAGQAAGFPDHGYREKGATVSPGAADVAAADILVVVQAAGADGMELAERSHPDQVVIGLFDPLGRPELCRSLADRKVVGFALELLPRITRAQGMDVLSSQASLAGYKAVILAAEVLPKIFPLMTTAAGTITPARVLVMGAGVAGLQAIATARRLGAVVQAYDVRPAVQEEVESLGARFVQLPLNPGDAQDASGYAKALGESFYRRQQELLAPVVSGSDAVITTAVIPGKPAPRLVTEEMVRGMAPGSVVVDLAAERGGNCVLTKPGETVQAHGVTIMGPTDLPSTVAFHASQMYAKNVSTFLLHLVKEGRLVIDMADQITSGTLVTRGGEVVHPKVVDALGEPGVGAKEVA
jgi:NAD(P) transhydrogenase subunit alpha